MEIRSTWVLSFSVRYFRHLKIMGKARQHSEKIGMVLVIPLFHSSFAYFWVDCRAPGRGKFHSIKWKAHKMKLKRAASILGGHKPFLTSIVVVVLAIVAPLRSGHSSSPYLLNPSCKLP